MNYYMPGGQVEAGGAPLDWVRASRFNRSRTKNLEARTPLANGEPDRGFTVTVEFSFIGAPEI